MVTADEGRDSRHGDAPTLQGRRPGWALPVGLGVGLLSAVGFFVLVAHGLSVLASIG